jgi:hypothetical protein
MWMKESFPGVTSKIESKEFNDVSSKKAVTPTRGKREEEYESTVSYLIFFRVTR